MADENTQAPQAAPASETPRRPYEGVPANVVRSVPNPASARLSWTDGERTIDYVSTAAHLDVRDDSGRLEGKMFSLSYVAVDEEGQPNATRPVTFAYNGGPGSASVPINFGGIGPRRVQTDGTNHLAASAQVTDNPHTLLKDSDLVFLDALGTGWSVVADDCDPATVFSVDGDADAFARAIMDWLEKNHRWSSPIYLYGESYGTFRNAVLMRLLGERSVKVTGVVMLSAIWDWVQTLPGEDLYYLGMMPTYAAAAQFFGRTGEGVDPDEWFDRAMDFADDTLAPALLRGDRLGAERERDVARQLSQFVGLPVDFLVRHHLRVELTEFRRELLRDEGRVCGRLDMRFCSDEPSPMQASLDWLGGEDAADDAVEANWTNAFRAFCADELGYQGPSVYLGQNWERVGHKWIWQHEVPGTGEKVGAPNVTGDVALALRRNPAMKLAIIGGRYDAATTFWNVRHDLSCQFLSPALKERVTWLRYGCGHMAYVDEPTLAAMDRDIHAFYQKA
ncbi:peptidase S10 [Olsenella sp. AM04-33]|uniref:S10 family peptidase n=1 Tax=Olsenella sp. AM04-33 TaxID=2292049 RepID=UPI000E49D56C|nr:peptidase S10 [Olsenella sp. AM04-33]RHK03910.1 peptidase S10 [Olsenella sp. AM04-33]